MQTNANPLITALCAILLLIGISACAGNRNNIEYEMEKMVTKQSMIPQPAPRPPVDADGSLWQAGSSLNGMFIDTKARNIGDIVTVRIEESAQATNKATTETERTSNLEAGIEKLFGLEDWWQNDILPSVKGSWPKIDPFGNPSIKGNLKSEFEGEGETSRSGSLDAFITCRVMEVMTNGNLKIVGTREVMVNHENQMIILSGIIRPRDIAEDNVIMSTFVSDAKIAYSGSGVVNDRQRPGWLTNLMNTVWPF
ncbi:Flagellar L-ring protein FlgH [Olavius sp. associated proteobacterium Delta 1]|nr:Flagellar L-ring protein FlgH [Olavius sp. associated proteobacterium Delta 1]